MSLKSFVKNDLWRVNYIYPFAKKHLADEKGKVDLAKQILRSYKNIHRVKGERPRTVGGDIKALLSCVDISLPEDGFVYFIDEHKTIALPGNVFNNMTVDYEKLIVRSFNERLSEVVGEGKPDDEYGRQIMLIAEGLKNLCERIVDALKNAKLPADTKLKRIDEFSNMLNRPAQSFEDALQRTMFFNQVMWQTRHRLNGFGHMDWFLGPYYEADIASGKITEEDVDRMLDDFFTKLSGYSYYKADALAGDIGQIIVLGGLKPDGTYHYNKLTEQIMRAQARINVPDPKTILRISEKMPRELMEVAVECLEAATGSPMFANDDVILPLLMDFGYPREDAYNYCVSACWEPFIVGKAFEQNNMATYDFSVAFDRLLKDCDDIDSFDGMVEKYIDLNEKVFKEFLVGISAQRWAKDPFVSFITDDCNKKRKDISEGGAKYNNYGVTTVAIANVVDSFFNIRKLVFEEKKYTLKQLAEIRQKNFEGADDLISYFKEHKFYGRDDRETLELVNRITASQASIAEQFKNMFGGTIKFGLSSPGYNASCKKMLGDFSGRKAGEPYNTHISCTGAGYTEIVNFSGQLEYNSQRFNGNVDDFFVSPDFLKNNKDKFVSFMMLAIKQGFFEMQMNIMASKTLIDAKAHPEKYPGLIVRVWGMSAYFNELPESYKNLLIERVIAAEKAI